MLVQKLLYFRTNSESLYFTTEGAEDLHIGLLAFRALFGTAI